MSRRASRGADAAPSRLVVFAQASVAATAGVVALGGVVAISPEGMAAFPIQSLWSRDDSGGSAIAAPAPWSSITAHPTPPGTPPATDVPQAPTEDPEPEEAPETPGPSVTTTTGTGVPVTVRTVPSTTEASQPGTSGPGAGPGGNRPSTSPSRPTPSRPTPSVPTPPVPRPPVPTPPVPTPDPTTPPPKHTPKPTPTPTPKPTPSPSTDDDDSPGPIGTCTPSNPGKRPTDPPGKGSASGRPDYSGDGGVGRNCKGKGPQR